ncbi:MAG: hypothetical protein COA78_35425 [Blastopirellula sp.]|nr:MAG: hypothetical protein COA78_35425 [Blastopirellula sp.]
MNDAFTKLSNTDLHAVITGLKTEQMAAPYTDLQVSRVVPASLISNVSTGLRSLDGFGFSAKQIVTVLELIELDRKNGPAVETPIDLVTSGPEAIGITNRDTSVVVRELFSHAKKSVLVVGYAVYQGRKVFESLAKRMEDKPGLDVQFFLNISRPDGDKTDSKILVTKYKQRLKTSSGRPDTGCPKFTMTHDP